MKIKISVRSSGVIVRRDQQIINNSRLAISWAGAPMEEEAPLKRQVCQFESGSAHYEDANSNTYGYSAS